MPARKTKSKKKNGKRNTKFQRFSNKVGYGYKTAFPPRAFAKLKYGSGNVGATSTVGVYANQFRLNGLYDPDYSGTGHQPMGFDEYAALYGDYRVHGCKVKIIAQITTAGQTGILFLGAKKGAAYHTATSISEWMEDSQIKHWVMNDEKPLVVSKYFDIARVFGKSKTAIRGEEGYSAGIGADPSNVAFATVGWVNIDETTSTGWNVRVELTYYCEFNSLVTLAGS